MNPLVSVIVPIYNIEQYLGLCIESILNQEFKDIEVILVDDGSNDRCPELCDLYAKKDSRVKVIHKSNGGLVSARKTGLKEAIGTYVSYVDGDDWIESSFIATLISAIQKHDCDMVCSGFSRDLFSKTETFANDYLCGLYESYGLKQLLREMISFDEYYHPGITTYVWNKLFKRELLEKVQFDVDNDISIGEDAAVTYPALLHSSRVAVIKDYSYHYRQREDSMLKKNDSPKQDINKLRCLQDFLVSWAESNDEYNLSDQVEDYILSTVIMRLGGYIPRNEYSIFGHKYFNKRIVIYSAGTFGQQLVNRFKENSHCDVVARIDDDYCEYRRCCLDVDPVEYVRQVDFDYILIAKIDPYMIREAKNRLTNMGIDEKKILKVTVPSEKRKLTDQFLDVRNYDCQSVKE